MRFRLSIRALFACLALALIGASSQVHTAAGGSLVEPPAAFSLGGVAYFHRYTNADQHEYTPQGQEDLNAWTDMVTINVYRTVKDGDALAATANNVLGTYKANNAVVVRTDSVARTATRPAEHLIVAIFPQPGFVEVAFARFRMHRGLGTAVVHSHRIYGKQAGDAMQAWLEKNGQTTETDLMRWDAMPALGAAR